MARELSPDSSFQVCVTEGQYHPSHNKEDNMIEIPLHVYGHDYKFFNITFHQSPTAFPGIRPGISPEICPGIGPISALKV